jgi:hypothetical protein
MACVGERAALDQVDPIQPPGPRRPWLSCVGESGSQYGDDLGFERRGWEVGQAPWILSLSEIILRASLALVNWRVNEGKASIFLTIQDYLLWF